MDNEQLQDVLVKHKRWINGFQDGARADLSCTDLSCADLRGANLRGADLFGAYLGGADLCGANLVGAELRRANLRRADLCGADLCGANLSEANLNGTKLFGANLGHNAVFAGATGAPIYQVTRGFGSRNATLTLYAQGPMTEWLFFTGCFKGSEKELREAIEEKYDGQAKQLYFAAVDYLLNVALANA